MHSSLLQPSSGQHTVCPSLGRQLPLQRVSSQSPFVSEGPSEFLEPFLRVYQTLRVGYQESKKVQVESVKWKLGRMQS